MAQTFDIRFARSDGLAAFLEAPGNRFRWKGGGLLSIESESIRFSVKRGLLTLFAQNQTRRIPADALKEVYREGEKLRVEFQTDKAAREVLPFWADNRDLAAEIVRLMPTSHTVEIEHSTEATDDAENSRFDGRAAGWMGVALGAVIASVWALYLLVSSTPSTTSPPTASASASVKDAPLSAADMTRRPQQSIANSVQGAEPSLVFASPEVVLPPLPSLPLPSDYVRSEDFVIPIARGTAAYEVARRELAIFERETTTLETDYRNAHALLTSQVVSAEDFAVRLDELEMRWWEVTFRIFASDALADPVLLDLRAAMLGSARRWRGFLTAYAIGLRNRDSVMIARSFDDLARAQELQSRARLFLRGS
jgi:hypothetical protein